MRLTNKLLTKRHTRSKKCSPKGAVAVNVRCSLGNNIAVGNVKGMSKRVYLFSFPIQQPKAKVFPLFTALKHFAEPDRTFCWPCS